MNGAYAGPADQYGTLRPPTVTSRASGSSPRSTRWASASQAGTSRGAPSAAPTRRRASTGRGGGRRSTAGGARAARGPRAAPGRAPSPSGPPPAPSRPARGRPACAPARHALVGAVVGVDGALVVGARLGRRARHLDVEVERADVVAERDEVVARVVLDLGELLGLAPALAADAAADGDRGAGRRPRRSARACRRPRRRRSSAPRARRSRLSTACAPFAACWAATASPAARRASRTARPRARCRRRRRACRPRPAAVAQLGRDLGPRGSGDSRQDRDADSRRLGLLDLRAQRVGVDVTLGLRVDVDADRSQRLARAVEHVLLARPRARRDEQDARRRGARARPSAAELLRRRSRSCVSFSSSRGCTIGTSIRAVKPLGLASTDCVSRVPAPDASSA